MRQLPCGSKRDKSLVPELSQSCPNVPHGSIPGVLGQNPEVLGQYFEGDLSNPNQLSTLPLGGAGTNGTSGTSGTSLFQHRGNRIPLSSDDLDLFEERAGILEYEAGFTRIEAEDRALDELSGETGKAEAA